MFVFLFAGYVLGGIVKTKKITGWVPVKVDPDRHPMQLSPYHKMIAAADRDNFSARHSRNVIWELWYANRMKGPCPMAYGDDESVTAYWDERLGINI